MRDRLYITFLPTYVAPVIPTPYFTDIFNTPSVACSFRKLSPDSVYSGAAFRVRRSIDNAEQDINFLSSEANALINETALTDFVGAGDGFITTWYDQSGNARNATQTSASLQYRIVNAGTVDKTGGQVSAIKTSAQYMDIPSFNHVDIYTVVRTSGGGVLAEVNTGGGTYSLVWESGSSSTALSAGFGTPTFYVDGAVSGTTRGQYYTDIATGVNVSIAQKGASITAALRQLAYPVFTPISMAGSVFEWIEYNTTQTDYADIITEQKAFYGIL